MGVGVGVCMQGGAWGVKEAAALLAVLAFCDFTGPATTEMMTGSRLLNSHALLLQPEHHPGVAHHKWWSHLSHPCDGSLLLLHHVRTSNSVQEQFPVRSGVSLLKPLVSPVSSPVPSV